ncbi:hypothetical protein [Listeria valentina]|uniref:hypothetical protein n=1 Tax=Listeria valentina TaxID=2705293 RepID=UPI00143062FC|nr:hypothetical protein [Listeria valentina]
MMEFLEFQAFIENDDLFPFYLREHVLGKKKILWQEQKISYSADKFILIDSGLVVKSYGKKQIIYQLAGKDQFIFFNQSDSYLEALERTHYREFQIKDVVEQLEEEKLLDHFLLFMFKKEEKIVQKLVELENMKVKERIYYLLNELFFLDYGSHIEDKKEGVYNLPSWLKMSVFTRLVRTSAANLSQQLHPLTRNHILRTHKKPWQINVKLWNDFYKNLFNL